MPSYRNTLHIPSLIVLICLCMSLMLTSCSMLNKLESPSFFLVAIKPMSSSGLLPSFVIDLKVVNPNAMALPLRSVHYELFLNNQKIVTGNGYDLPEIPPHGATIITISAVPELEGALNLVEQWVSAPQQQWRYTFAAELDPGLAIPSLKMTRSGSLNLPK